VVDRQQCSKSNAEKNFQIENDDKSFDHRCGFILTHDHQMKKLLFLLLLMFGEDWMQWMESSFWF